MCFPNIAIAGQLSLCRVTLVEARSFRQTPCQRLALQCLASGMVVPPPFCDVWLESGPRLGPGWSLQVPLPAAVLLMR
jgi:hypothetical protein